MLPIFATTLRASALGTTLSLVLLACGAEESTAPTSPSPSTPQAGSPAEPPAPSAKKAHRPVKIEEEGGNPVRFTGQNEEGQQFQASIGENAEVPADFPSDVPTYEGARPMAAMSAAGEGTVVTFQSADGQQQIYEFYQSALADQGWSVDSEKEFGGQRSLDASKDSRKLSVSITGTKGDSRISIMVTGIN